MSYTDYLVAKAEILWEAGLRLPTDLFSKLLEAGIDVDALERNFHNKQEAENG